MPDCIPSSEAKLAGSTITPPASAPTARRAPLQPNTAEARQYRGRYKDNDLPVGEWSDVITVTAQA